MKLNTLITENEKKVLDSYCGKEYIVLEECKGEHYVNCGNGRFTYNDCFGYTDSNFFSAQKYDKVTPYRIINFFYFYIMETLEEPGVFYRGRELKTEKYEYDVYGDSLEEILSSL